MAAKSVPVSATWRAAKMRAWFMLDAGTNIRLVPCRKTEPGAARSIKHRKAPCRCSPEQRCPPTRLPATTTSQATPPTASSGIFHSLAASAGGQVPHALAHAIVSAATAPAPIPAKASSPPVSKPATDTRQRGLQRPRGASVVQRAGVPLLLTGRTAAWSRHPVCNCGSRREPIYSTAYRQLGQSLHYSAAASYACDQAVQ